MRLKDRFLFWLVIFAALTLFLWLFQPILLPFITGIIIAYLLNPLVIRLQGLNISRGLSAVVILISFIVALVLLFIIVTPRIYQEILQLAEAAPGYIDELWQKTQPILQMLQIDINESTLNENLGDLVKNNIRSTLDLSTNLLAEILSSSRALLNLMIFFLLTPLVSFFLMKDWPLLADWVEDILPRKQKQDVMDLLGRIDKKIAGFVRGQMIIAVALGFLYALILVVIGLDYGFLIGLVSGVLSIIPLFGSIIGLLLGVSAAFLQGGSLIFVASVAGIFIAGQFLEGNFITPKIMSGSVGLHPLWILFALMAGNSLMGVAGMLLAIPVAASVGVLADYFIEQYKSSRYYESK